jgi:hypothetical protein
MKTKRSHRRISMTFELDAVKQHIVIPDIVVLNGRTFRGFHSLPRHEAERLYAGLVRYGNSCGCTTGAIGTLLSICLYLLGSVWLPILLAEPVSASWQLGVVAAVVGGVVGKCVGLWRDYRCFESLGREFDLLTNSQELPKHTS